MKTFPTWAGLGAVLGLTLAVFPGCESTDSGGSTYVSGGVYYGTGFQDPWYYGGYDGDVDIIVTPPPGRPEAPLRPEHPIAPAPSPAPRPTPMPSIPAAPRPSFRR